MIHCRSSADEADELRRTLDGLGVKCWTVIADFEKPDEYGTLIRRSMESSGSLDILVNCASMFPSNTIDSVDFRSLMQNMEVNAWAPFVLSREFARSTTGQGKIINFLDSRINGYDWTHVAYILSKHVFAELTKMTAIKFAPRITINGVSPGLILPPPGKAQSYLDRLVNTVPLKRHGDAGDIVDAVIYLLKSDFLTGQIINVDGGRHLMEYTNGPHPG